MKNAIPFDWDKLEIWDTVIIQHWGTVNWVFYPDDAKKHKIKDFDIKTETILYDVDRTRILYNDNNNYKVYIKKRNKNNWLQKLFSFISNKSCS